jgi:hypothetical protein
MIEIRAPGSTTGGIPRSGRRPRMTLLKFRYEYPPGEAHFLEAPSAEAAVLFLPTLREISRWPAFWKTVDHQGLVLPDNALPRS